jgi:hypothetical protein
MKSELEVIPGIGRNMVTHLNKLGIFKVSDLLGKSPEVLYQLEEDMEGTHIDRCVLYVYRCAVYYAETKNPEPEKLKWWKWKDSL